MKNLTPGKEMFNKNDIIVTRANGYKIAVNILLEIRVKSLIMR